MNSRIALSALFVPIAAMVIASHTAGLSEKLKVLPASPAVKIFESRALPDLDHSTTARSQRARGTTSPDSKNMTLNVPDATHCLASHARHLQRFVLTLIDSDHQGE